MASVAQPASARLDVTSAFERAFAGVVRVLLLAASKALAVTVAVAALVRIAINVEVALGIASGLAAAGIAKVLPALDHLVSIAVVRVGTLVHARRLIASFLGSVGELTHVRRIASVTGCLRGALLTREKPHTVVERVRQGMRAAVGWSRDAAALAVTDDTCVAQPSAIPHHVRCRKLQVRA